MPKQASLTVPPFFVACAQLKTAAAGAPLELLTVKHPRVQEVMALQEALTPIGGVEWKEFVRNVNRAASKSSLRSVNH